MSLFSESDLKYLQKKGISKDKIRDQLDTFRAGIPFVKLEKAAVIGDGISKFSQSEEEALVFEYDNLKSGLSLLKFVPASGAASRMFKSLFNFLDAYNPSEEKLEAYFERTSDHALKVFFERLEDFPFYEIIKNRIEGKAKTEGEAVYFFVKELLSKEGLNYGFYPKGLLPFHDTGCNSFRRAFKGRSYVC